ncbi:MAG: iron dicitrate transport regulator FecR [Brevundimonas sp.]|nr:MAG: iron dicitrate transport regulator FecR [Brevundimonas sp.]
MNGMMRDPPNPESDSTRAGAASRAEAMEAAALWHARLDSGSADLEAFERWRAADPSHAIAFARTVATWEALPSGLAAHPRPAARSRRAVFLALGALSLTVAGVGVSGRVWAREHASTKVGERRTVRLSADAHADLNTDTRLSWRSRGDQLTLWLDRGEVAVAARPEAGSVLLHAGGVVCALSPGRYNARLEAGRVDVTPLDGVVVGRTPAGAPIRAVRGQRLLARDGEIAAGAAPPEELDRIAAWPEGEVVFNGTPLSEAVAEYNRYLDRKLVIEDQRLGRLTIGGRFTSTDPSDFLSALQAIMPLRILRTPDTVILATAE